jgi:hypothetical protein
VSLSKLDRELVERETFDPAATIAYHEIAGCLVWSDEVPDGLSASGHEYVRDLLGARGYIHRGVPVEAWDLGSTVLAERWDQARAAGLRWNGFQRLALTVEQRALLQRYMEDQSEL